MPFFIRITGICLLTLAFFGQQANAQSQTRKAKTSKYQDDIILIYKNQVSVRLPIGFYGYHLFQKTYDKKHTPILLGLRFERLFTAKFTAGVEWEYNSWDPFPANANNRYREVNPDGLPPEETINKFNLFGKIYIRTKSNRKSTFSGLTIAGGPSIFTIAQQLDPFQKVLGRDVYKSKTELGLFLAPGISITKNQFVFSSSVETLFSPKNFRQEGYFSSKLGNASYHINIFKFNLGYVF